MAKRGSKKWLRKKLAKVTAELVVTRRAIDERVRQAGERYVAMRKIALRRGRECDKLVGDLALMREEVRKAEKARDALIDGEFKDRGERIAVLEVRVSELDGMVSSLRRERDELEDRVQKAEGVKNRILPCQAGPAGWTCSRERGHAGPCAASKVYMSSDAAEGLARPADEGTRQALGRAVSAVARYCPHARTIRSHPGSAPSLECSCCKNAFTLPDLPASGKCLACERDPS